MQKCFYAMFDILAFSSLLNIRGSESLHHLMSNFVLPMVQHAAMPRSIIRMTPSGGTKSPDPRSQRVFYNIFSDTIVYYTKDDSRDSFFSIVSTAFFLLQSGFSGSKAPFRGAIGYGDFVSSPNGFSLGTSVIDAYKGEQSQMWAGCILTKDCESCCEQNGYIDAFHQASPKILVSYSVPKQKKVTEKPTEYYQETHFVLDWTHNMYKGAAKNSFNPSDIPHQRMIRENTIDFELWAWENNRLKV